MCFFILTLVKYLHIYTVYFILESGGMKKSIYVDYFGRIVRNRTISCLSLIAIFVTGSADTWSMQHFGHWRSLSNYSVGDGSDPFKETTDEQKQGATDDFIAEVCEFRSLPRKGDVCDSCRRTGEGEVCELCLKPREVFLVISDSGRAHFNHPEIREGDSNHPSYVSDHRDLGEPTHRFWEIYWAFVDPLFGTGGGDLDFSGKSNERVGLRGDACDPRTWELISASLPGEVLYIVDDFYSMSLLKSENICPITRSIYDVLSPGGMFVSALSFAKISIDDACFVCGLFDVFISDDVYSMVQQGYVAPAWNRDRSVNPFFYCLRFFAQHPSDRRLARLSSSAKGLLVFANKEIEEIETWFAKKEISKCSFHLALAFFRQTYEIVEKYLPVVEELALLWDNKELSHTENWVALSAQELSEYARTRTFDTFKRLSTIVAHSDNGTGIFICLVKKKSDGSATLVSDKFGILQPEILLPNGHVAGRRSFGRLEAVQEESVRRLEAEQAESARRREAMWLREAIQVESARLPERPKEKVTTAALSARPLAVE
jgi:hypothetical protein